LFTSAAPELELALELVELVDVELLVDIVPPVPLDDDVAVLPPVPVSPVPSVEPPVPLLLPQAPIAAEPTTHITESQTVLPIVQAPFNRSVTDPLGG
jgi:hypothetical protein